MTPSAWLTVAVLGGVLALLATDRHPPALVVFGGAVLLMILGVTTPAEALAGFANPAPFTVAALYVVARGVEKTGALRPLLTGVLGRGGGRRMTLTRLLLPVAATSGFLNNTPIVAMVSPQVSQWAERQGKPASWYLMPLSFAAILGGLVTVIGTSTNIVISGLLESHGMEPMGMFEISRVGLPVAVAGVTLLILLAPVLLPDRRGLLKSVEDESRDFAVQMLVEEGGPLEGKTVEQAGLRHLKGVFLAEVHRTDEVVAPATPDTRLRGGDRLIFVGRAELIPDLQNKRGLRSAEGEHMLTFTDPGHTYFEAVIGAGSVLSGKTLKESDFRSRYGGAVLAIHRAGGRVHAKLGEVPLRPGDTLLLLAGPDFETRSRHRSDFLLVARLGGLAPSTTSQAWAVGAVLAGIVGLGATGLLPILHASVAGAFLLLLGRVLTLEEARRAVDLGVVVLIAAAFGLAGGIEASGLDSIVAESIVAAGSALGPTGVLLGLVVTTVVLTELVTNNAAAVLLFPIALSVALELGQDPRPFAMAVALAASASFLTPIGYQTNTMVYGPGGYRFGDYARLGLPLTVLVVAMLVVLVPVMW